ncbi:MAG TPA: MFS transporter [Acinetobacter radioresistens]|nr:MFS transporter [Acinetobacter radioresistens]
MSRHLYLLLFSLYWAQGLPVGFMTHALPVILRMQGVSLAHIGGFGLLMLPWSIKILWAPWIDRYGTQRFGHYRSWIIPTQLCSVLILIALSFLPIQALDQPVFLLTFFAALMLLNLAGATQDVATDGLAVHLLTLKQQHWGNTFQVIGSRLGFIVGGGALLWALDWLSWQPTFLVLAALVLLNTLPIVLFKEPAKEVSVFYEKISCKQSIRQYFNYFLNNRILKSWLGVLVTFKVADGLSGPLLKPLMVDLGLSLSQIGIYITILGAVAALFGAVLAGTLLRWMRRTQALFLFSFFKVLSLIAYAWLAYCYDQQYRVSHWLIYCINAAEDMISAMLLVVMLTLVMQYSRKQHAATDFTFQVALMATISGLLYTLSGIAGDWLGYAYYVNIIIGISILCMYPIWLWTKVSQHPSDV